jgi:hypothetical protein
LELIKSGKSCRLVSNSVETKAGQDFDTV